MNVVQFPRREPTDRFLCSVAFFECDGAFVARLADVSGYGLALLGDGPAERLRVIADLMRRHAEDIEAHAASLDDLNAALTAELSTDHGRRED